VKRIQHHFGKRLLFVFRNFPLSQMHPDAEAAAETAEFAGAEGKFWQMHDGLFRNQKRLGLSLFEELAEDMGLDKSKLDRALDTKEFESRVREDFTGGVRSGVNGTPTFFINGQRNNGPVDYDYLVNAIEEAARVK
jgi:protein-disulfide isomerase